MKRGTQKIIGRRFLALLGALPFLLGSFPGDSSADTSFYKKEVNGVVHYTNINPKSKDFKRIASPWGTFRGTPKSQRGYLNNHKYSDKFDKHINQTARENGLDPLLVKAMIKVESNFNPDAVSPAGAMGVMQLMPGTAERVGVADAFDPEENINGGIKYLAMLMKLFNNNTTLAIAGYNAGENAVIKYGYKIPPYEETIEYVDRVYAHYDHLRNYHVNRNTKSMVATGKDKVSSPGKAGSSKSSKSFMYVETANSAKVYKNGKQVASSSVEPAPGTRGRTLLGAGAGTKTAAVLKAESAVSGSEGRYTVQVASFPDKASAEEMEMRFKAKRYPAYSEEVKIPGKGTWYRVKIGKFTTQGEANRYGNDMKSAEPGVDSILVTMN